MRLRMAQNRRRVRDRARERPPRRDALEFLHLPFDAALVVRSREVRHQSDPLHGAMRCQQVERRHRFGRSESKPVHAGVDLEHDVELRPGRRRIEHLELGTLMNRNRKIMLHGQRHFRRFEQAFEQCDAFAVACFAQSYRRFDFKQGKTVGSFKRKYRPRKSMAVRVCLHHREHPGTRRTPAHDAEVVAHRIDADDGFDGTHGSIFRIEDWGLRIED